jgi:flagellar motor switch protein FliG
VRCLANPSGIPTPQVLAEIGDGLRARIDQLQHGGPARAARILSHCDRQLEWSLLQSLREADADLSATIEQIRFCFADLAVIDPRSVKSLLRNIPLTTWAMAMKRSNGPLKQAIEANLCRRAIELLGEEMDYLGAVTDAQIERAQQEIVAAGRRLFAPPSDRPSISSIG